MFKQACLVNKHMKILHIGKYYPPFSGGIENFMGNLLPLLASENTQVHALVHNHELSLTASEQLYHQVKVIRIPSYGRILFAPVSPLFPFYLNHEIKSFQPDIIHIHMPNTSAFWLLMLPSAKKIPWIIHWHSDVVNTHLGRVFSLAYRAYKPFEQLLLKKSKSIIATSPHYLKSSPALKKWQQKTQIIPLGIDLQIPVLTQQSLIEAKQFWGDAKYKLLAIGRLTYYKGHQYLIEAMKNTDQGKLIIIGHGEEHGRLTRLINKLALNQQVILAGKLDDNLLHALLSSCDIFCLPSIERTEAFGLVLLEAMSHSRPLLVSNIPGSGMTWVCQDQKTGLFSTPMDSHDINQKIQQLLDHKDKQAEYGKKGYERLKHEFSLESVTKKTLALYHQIIA